MTYVCDHLRQQDAGRRKKLVEQGEEADAEQAANKRADHENINHADTFEGKRTAEEDKNDEGQRFIGDEEETADAGGPPTEMQVLRVCRVHTAHQTT